MSTFPKDLRALKRTLNPGDEWEVHLQAITSRILPSPVSVLDVGGGSGASTVRLLQEMAVRGYEPHTTVVDPSVSAEITGVLSGPDSLFEGSLDAFDTNRRFDIVKATQVFYYLGESRTALERLLSLASRGGCVLLTTWTRNCGLFGLYDAVLRDGRPEFTAEEIAVVTAAVTGETPELVRSSGTIAVSDWKLSQETLRAVCRVISRSPNAPTESTYARFERTLQSRPDLVERENGTLVIDA